MIATILYSPVSSGASDLAVLWGCAAVAMLAALICYRQELLVLARQRQARVIAAAVVLAVIFSLVAHVANAAVIDWDCGIWPEWLCLMI